MPPLAEQAIVHTQTLEDWAKLAHQLAPALRPGDVITLDGPLGAGKTTFTSYLGQALGLKEPVASPTFVLMHEYRTGVFPVVHADLYRLGDGNAGSLADELFAVIEEGRSLVLVEWACYGPFLEPVTTVSVEIQPDPTEAAPERRRVTLAADRPLPVRGSEGA